MSFNIKYLTQEETKRLFEVIKKKGSKRDQAMFKVIYDYGLRASEVGLLLIDDVDLKRRKIKIQRLKDGYTGEKPITSDTAKVLKAYIEERKKKKDFNPILFISKKQNPISRNRLHEIFCKYAEEANLPKDKRHVHVLRHSIATHLLDAGQPIEYVQDHLGHKSINSTSIYAKITDKKRTQVFREMERSSQIVKIG